MSGSMLIILLGLLLVPSLGWRWMIRVSIAPSVILIFLFKVGVSVLVLRLSRPDPSFLSKPVYSRIGSLQRVCWKRSCCHGDAAEDRSHEPVFAPSWPPGGAASGGFLLRFLLRFLREGRWWSWSVELLKFWFVPLLFPEEEGGLEDPAELLPMENIRSALVLMVGLCCSFVIFPS